MERLQRVLASHGIASRRKAEELILAGRVTVDGEVVRELGTQVDPEKQDIRVEGNRIQRERRRYIMLNKPPGYITTSSDERGRRTVLDLVQVPERVVPVGRLDRQTSGLLLLTNDGDVAFRVTHPRYGIEKEYEALVDGHPPPQVLETLRRGVSVEGQRVQPEQVRPLRNEEAGTLLRIVIHEGRNRIVRRMLDYVGYPALKLTRTRVGPLQIHGVPLGTWRDLTEGELRQLREAVRLGEEDLARVPPSPQLRETGGEPSRLRRMKGNRPGRPAGPPKPGRKTPSRPGRPRPSRAGENQENPSKQAEHPAQAEQGHGEGQQRPRRPQRGTPPRSGPARRPPGDRDRRSGGGRQDRRRQRGRPPA